MYSNILVPVMLDHAAQARHALKVAKMLSAKGAKIKLLHVFEDVPGYVAGYIPTDILKRNRNEAMAKLQAIADDDEGVAAELINGHSSRAILDFADKSGSDCIVVSSHRPGLEDYFIGSTAAHVVRHARCSVHVIR